MTARAPASIGGILFDVDGTLVDSTFVHTVCWWQAFRQQGIDAPMARIHRAIGMGSDKLIGQVLGGTDGVDEDALAAGHDALYATYWPALRPLPGAREVLRACAEAGLRTVLASSAAERELTVLRRVLDADEWLHAATSSAEAEASKPAPDIVEVALRKAGLQPSEAVFVGDAVWDVRAGTALGVACIGLECGGTSAAELREAGAFATYADPADLLSHSAELPFLGARS
ncbi:MAG TPA: HAD family hydrolase [Jatrophihabitans sp.]|nr:HAD family hydrolase [Jatrophihabitans sp.]